MLLRFGVALFLGALIGVEREMAGKEAGVRTSMMVSGGAAMFSIAAIQLPYLIATSPAEIPNIMAHNSGFLAIIANIVVGIGFLGAGMIFKTESHVHSLTTAAVIWAAAAIGMLSGIGLMNFATAATIIISTLLYIMRRVGISEKLRHD